MPTTVHGTATIYQFPPRPLTAGQRRRDGGQPVAALRTHSLPTIDCTGSWYHEAALQDADRSRKS